MDPGYTIDAAFLADLRAMRREWLLGQPAAGNLSQQLQRPPRELHFVNLSGETVPAFGVMKITDVDKQHLDFYEIIKPNGSGLRFLINGPRPVANGDRGVAFRFGRALYETGDGTPAFGEAWGPTTDWKLHKGTTGFEVQGAPSDGSVVVWDVPSEPALAKISGGIARRASGVCLSATATIWEINGSNTVAATSKTQTVFNPSGLPIIGGELVLIKRTSNGKWIVTEICGGMRDFHFRAQITDSALAINVAIPTTGLTGGTVWAGSNVFPVYYSSPVALVQFPGYYHLHAVLNIASNFVQPADNTHHQATITFAAALNGAVISSAGYVTFVYPALETDTGLDTNGDTDFTHTFVGIDGPVQQCVVDAIVTKIGTTAQTIDIRATQIAPVGAPVIADYAVLSSSFIELKPIGYGETQGAWVV